MSNTLDPRALRSALGTFATGITIVTTRDAQGRDWGLTVNSFNSVSLEPPLVLWSLGKRNEATLTAFRDAGHFAVHVLAADQEALSNLFASPNADRFSAQEITRGAGDVPLLPGCLAVFQCRTATVHAGGDHEIFIGEVLDFSSREGAPLLYHGGRYARLAE